MRYKDKGYNRLLVGDFYHWESEIDGNFAIAQNSNKKTAMGGG